MVEAARSPPDNHANAERISPPRPHQRAQIPYQKRRDEHKKCPAPEDRRGAASGSVAGVPDDGEGIVIVLPGGAAEIGVEGPATEEFGVRERQPDIFALGHLAGPDPAAAVVDGARADLVVSSEEHTSELQ